MDNGIDVHFTFFLVKNIHAFIAVKFGTAMNVTKNTISELWTEGWAFGFELSAFCS